MRTILFTTLFALSISLFAITGEAQRTRRPTAKPTPKPTPIRTTPTNAVVSSAKQQVSTQLHNVNVFVDRIGPIAVTLESMERDALSRRLSGDKLAVHEKNKKDVVAAFAGLRTALVKLESDFRTKPQLSQYLAKIQGISTLAANAEDSAIAAKFVAAKDPLREVSLKLNDTLAVMPGPGSTMPVRAGSSTTVPTRPVSNTVPVGTNRPTPTATGKREPAVGMTAAEVAESTWGTTTNKRTTVGYMAGER